MNDAASEVRLGDEERAKTIRLLRESQKAFLEAVGALTDAQWSYKPTPDRWSVGEVAEHLVLAEAALFANLERALSQDPDPAWRTRTTGKTEFLERVLVSRDGKAQAPESVRPLGQLTRAEVLNRYKDIRAKTLEFAQHTDHPLKAVTREHPFPIFGTLSGYQWLLYIPLHNVRHNQQIDEVESLDG